MASRPRSIWRRAWSHRDGLNIKGGAGLSTVLDIHKKAGPLRVDSLALADQGRTAGRDGHRRRDRRREHRPGHRVGRRHGRRGGAEVLAGQPRSRRSRARASCRPRASACPSTRAASSPAAASSSGTRPRRLYAGVMQLSLHDDITLKAFGLIATRMPDGSRGYSLHRLHHRRGLPADPAAARLQAAGHRRHGRREPHVRRGRPARRASRTARWRRCCSRAIRSAMRRR